MPSGESPRRDAASEGFDARMVEKANRARAAATAARAAAIEAETQLEERRRIHDAEIQQLLALRVFAGAAAYEKREGANGRRMSCQKPTGY